MRAVSASRLPLAATLLAAISLASFDTVAQAEEVEFYYNRIAHQRAPSNGPTAITDLPTLPGGPSSVQQPKFGTRLPAAPQQNSAMPKRIEYGASGKHIPPRGIPQQESMHLGGIGSRRRARR